VKESGRKHHYGAVALLLGGILMAIALAGSVLALVANVDSSDTGLKGYASALGILAALITIAVWMPQIYTTWTLKVYLFSLSAHESYESNLLEADWHGYFFLHRKDRVLVGNGAFKGPPDDTGTIEIGYEIASEYWNRGLATEAAQGMIDLRSLTKR